MEGYGKNYVPDTIWNNKTNEDEEMSLNVKAFLVDLVCVCKKHGLSIAHEDGQGSFLIEEYKDVNMQWLCGASNNIKG